MSHNSVCEFYSSTIPDSDDKVQIFRYVNKSTNTVYFGLQSIALYIHRLLINFRASIIFTEDFNQQWQRLGRLMFTELDASLILPTSTIISSTILDQNTLPEIFRSNMYVNEDYRRLIETHSQIETISFDYSSFLCTATRIPFRVAKSLGLLAFAQILKPTYFHMLYVAFFKSHSFNEQLVTYLAGELRTSRRLYAEFIPYPQSYNELIISATQDIISQEELIQSLQNNVRCIYTFHFNLNDIQVKNILKDANILRTFDSNNEQTELEFKELQTCHRALIETRRKEEENRNLEYVDIDEPLNRLHSQKKLPLSYKTTSDHTLAILRILVRIFIVVNRYLGVTITQEQEEFFTQIFELVRMTKDDYDFVTFENDKPFKLKDERSKYFKIGEIVHLFIQLDRLARITADTLWWSHFLDNLCTRDFHTIIDTISDYTRFLKHYYIGGIYESAIANLIIFMHGVCNIEKKNIDVLKNIRSFGSNFNSVKNFYIINFNTPKDSPLLAYFQEALLNPDRLKLFKFQPNEMKALLQRNQIKTKDQESIINYCVELLHKADESKNTPNEYDPDLDGEIRFKFSTIDFTKLIPLPSANTFNVNNAPTESMKLYTQTIGVAHLFHEICIQQRYGIPGIVCNIKSNVK